jgi:hypothetical protein
MGKGFSNLFKPGSSSKSSPLPPCTNKDFTKANLQAARNAAVKSVNDEYKRINDDISLTPYEKASKISELYNKYNIDGIFKDILKENGLDTSSFCDINVRALKSQYDKNKDLLNISNNDVINNISGKLADKAKQEIDIATNSKFIASNDTTVNDYNIRLDQQLDDANTSKRNALSSISTEYTPIINSSQYSSDISLNGYTSSLNAINSTNSINYQNNNTSINVYDDIINRQIPAIYKKEISDVSGVYYKTIYSSIATQNIGVNELLNNIKKIHSVDNRRMKYEYDPINKLTAANVYIWYLYYIILIYVIYITTTISVEIASSGLKIILILIMIIYPQLAPILEDYLYYILKNLQDNIYGYLMLNKPF